MAAVARENEEARSRVPENHPLRGERFWSRSSPERSWDYLVVGSGIGGLTAGALLAELGRRVLVVEQHYVPGGFTHAFSHGGYVWDVGVHAVGGVTHHSFSGRLLARLTGERLRWESLGPVYEDFHYPDGFRIQFPDSPEEFRARLVAAFPQESTAIDQYLRLVGDAAAAMKALYLARFWPPRVAPVTDRLFARKGRRYAALTTDDVLSKITDDERLKAVLTGQWGYYGAVPERSSFGLHAMVAKHFLHGAYFPVGGAQEIARELTRTIAARGGWTRICGAVEEIVVEGGRAVGVRFEGGEEIRARRVVVATGIGAATRRLLPEPLRSADWAQSVRDLRPGPAHVCLYLGFKGDITRAGATAANQWYYHSWSPEELWRLDGEGTLPPAPVLYASFPSLKDPAHEPGPEERHTGEVVTFVPWESFARWQETRWSRRGEGYEELKSRIHERLLEQFLEHLPGLRPLVDFAELSTPLSTDHFCRPLAGSIYGLEATPVRFRNRWLRPRSPLRNLFFAGSDVTSGGVIGAFWGGVLAVVGAEPIRALGLLKSVLR